MRAYPKKRNGDEYYPSRGTEIFVVDDRGAEVYARDRKGNQLYPPSGRERIFARDAAGELYYARDAAGNECYPVRRNKSLFVTDPANEGAVRLALSADGTQRYPRDGRGNEYYLRERGAPLLLRKNTGEHYLAESRNGHSLIPWNRLHEHVGEEPCVYSRDSDGNTVYVKESAFPPAFRAVVRCVCNLSVVCPRVTGCHARFY